MAIAIGTIVKSIIKNINWTIHEMSVICLKFHVWNNQKAAYYTIPSKLIYLARDGNPGPNRFSLQANSEITRDDRDYR